MSEHTHAPPSHAAHSTSQEQPRVQKGAFEKLIPELKRAVAAEGYVYPTPIQKQCIPPLLEGRDVLGTAQTGTGKTAAFVLPILQQLSQNPSQLQKGTPRALILAPTRELAAQIGASIEAYGRFLHIRHTVVFGGVSQFHQVKALDLGVDILVATPGRLLDLMQQGLIHLNEVEFFVLDEVDRMLDMGFIPDIKRLLYKIPADRQTLFFSATMPKNILALAHSMVRDPIRVTIEPDKPTVECIVQKILFVGKKNKDALLASLLEDPKFKKVLIFTQRKHAANQLMKKLRAAGIYCDAIHGDRKQSARTRVLNDFKQDRFRVLVATDVAARGLDIGDITHVINYDLPMEAETYVNRIGRTARAGADGDAISFCCAEDRGYLRKIERMLGKPVPADMNHAYHCDDAFRDTKPAPSNAGRKGGGRRRSGWRGGKSHGPRRRYRGRRTR